MFTYSDIIYVGSSKPLICRDGNLQYARSMDLNFITYDELRWMDSKSLYFIIDISAGWTTSEDMDIIEEFVDRIPSKRMSIRLVDQFEHQRDTDTYLRMAKMSIDYCIPIIGTYDVDYYDLDVELIIPYPYLDNEEIKVPINERILSSAILTGANVKGIYPMRETLYSISYDSERINTISHPGYSGKGWKTGIIGENYLKSLSKYMFMICTTCNESYELLKYIECAEVGCIPIGEVPNSLKETEAEKYIVEIPNEALISPTSFDSWYLNTMNKIDYHRYSVSYKNCIKSMRDKDLLKDRLLTYINKMYGNF